MLCWADGVIMAVTADILFLSNRAASPCLLPSCFSNFESFLRLDSNRALGDGSLRQKKYTVLKPLQSKPGLALSIETACSSTW